MTLRRIAAAALAVLAGVLTTADVAHAKRSDEVDYRFEQVWSATVRLVRVDYGFPLKDRDKGVGYLLFEYQDGGRSYPGSFEIVKTREDGRERIRIELTIPAMPSYIERMMLDKLGRKLEEDFGPPPPPKKKRPPKNDDDGDDGDDGGGNGDHGEDGKQGDGSEHGDD